MPGMTLARPAPGSPARRRFTAPDVRLYAELSRFCTEGENKGKPGVCPTKTATGSTKKAFPTGEEGVVHLNNRLAASGIPLDASKLAPAGVDFLKPWSKKAPDTIAQHDPLSGKIKIVDHPLLSEEEKMEGAVHELTHALDLHHGPEAFKPASKDEKHELGQLASKALADPGLRAEIEKLGYREHELLPEALAYLGSRWARKQMGQPTSDNPALDALLPKFESILTKHAGSMSKPHSERFSESDTLLFAELERFCQEGKNKGKPGVCPNESAASTTTTVAAPKQGAPAKAAKPKATRGPMSAARREGEGKDAKIVLADGSPAPSHITPAMVPPGWTDVKVSIDPKADVLVQALDKKGNAKTVYSDGWDMKAAAAKFSRIHDALHEMPDMTAQVQRDRADPKKAGAADCTWLMQEQGTRPGSEADNKGVSKLFGHKLTAGDVTLGEPDKKGVPAVTLKIGGKEIKIRDKKARAELARRKEAGEPLHDSTFWFKSHGATTLEGRHIVETKEGVRLQFMGKESVWHDHLVRDPKLADMLLQRKKSAGDDGKLFGVSDAQASAYAKTLDHGGFSPKDWRTARATRLAIEEINRMEPPKSEKDYKAAAMSVAKKVSGVLGNEPAQALSSYISPTVFSGWRAAVA
jgi:DNA topoisomerase IB